MSGKITRIALWVLFFSFIAVGTAAAQTISLNVQDQPTGSATARIFNIILMITVLSIAPSILVMMTSFTRIIVVFSITRSALATNSTPPNMVLISLALFLTMFIMAPTFEKVWDEGIKPMYEEKLEITEGLEKAAAPMKEFMVRNTREKDLLLFTDLAKEKPAESIEATPLKVAIPAFLLCTGLELPQTLFEAARGMLTLPDLLTGIGIGLFGLCGLGCAWEACGKETE